MKTSKLLCLIGCLSVLSSQPASAYWMSADTGMSLSVGAGNYLLSQQVLKDASKSTTSGRPASQATLSQAQLARTSFKPQPSAAAFDRLAGFYPAEQRAHMRQTFMQLHAAYPQVAKKLGIPINDLASGIASYVAGAYMAYHNRNIGNDHVKPLADQFRQVLASESGFSRTSDREKQNLYDFMVTLGMMMAIMQIELEKQPNAQTAAQLREMGKQCLEGFLKVDASRVRLTSTGLRVN